MNAVEPNDPEPGTPDIVNLSGVSFAWPGADSFALSIKEFRLAKGSRSLLIGPSGSGKSTLLSLICGIVRPDTGTVQVLGEPLERMSDTARDRFRAEHIGVIFQMFNLLPYGSVLDNVMLPLSFAPARRARAATHRPVDEEAGRILTDLGLPENKLASAAATLSIGQQQRVAAARALIGSPELIVADEPTSALDKVHQARFLDLLFAQVDAARSTLIMVSHDESLASRFDTVIDLQDTIAVEAAA